MNDVVDERDEMEVLRRKKLRILRDDDWLGLSIQQPIKLRYAPNGPDDRIGRRRKLRPGHEVKYDKAQSRFSPRRHPSGTQQSEVMVYIDGKERRTGVSSSAAPSMSKSQLPMLSSQSSDIMLLDEKFGSEASFRAVARNGATVYNHIPSHHHDPKIQQSLGVGHKGIIAEQSFGDSKRGHHHHEDATRLQGNGDPLWEDPWLSYARMFYRIDQKQTQVSTAISSSSIREVAQRKGYEPNVPGANYEHARGMQLSEYDGSFEFKRKHGHAVGPHIMPSSPPVLHHPVPQSSTSSKVLRTSSAELASSVAATIGVLPKATEGEEKDNEIWKSWLDEDAAEDAEDAHDESEEERVASIIPDISAYVPQRVKQLASAGSSRHETSSTVSKDLRISLRVMNGNLPPGTMRLSTSAASTTASGRMVASRSEYSEEECQVDSSPVAQETAPTPPPFVRPKTPEPPTVKSVNDQAEEAWKSFMLPSPSQIIPQYVINEAFLFQEKRLDKAPFQVEPKPKTPDPDAAWKAFVLTSESDSDEESAAFTSFWKRPYKDATSRDAQQAQSPSKVSLKVDREETIAEPELEPELPFSKPGIRIQLKRPRRPGFLSSGSGDYFDVTQVLDGRSMVANRSEATGTSSYFDGTQVLDDRSIYANQSQKLSTSSSVYSPRATSKGEIRLNKGSGQTIVDGYFKKHQPQSMTSRKPTTFRRPVSFGAMKKAAEDASFEDGLDKQLRDALQKGRDFLKKAEGESQGEKARTAQHKAETGREKSIWDIPSSEDGHY